MNIPESFNKKFLMNAWSADQTDLMPLAAALHLAHLKDWIGLDGSVSLSKAGDEHYWISKRGAGWDSTKLPSPHHFEKLKITCPTDVETPYERIQHACHAFGSGDRAVLHVFPVSTLAALKSHRPLAWFIDEHSLMGQHFEFTALSATALLSYLEEGCGHKKRAEVIASPDLGVVSVAPTVDEARLQVERLVRCSQILLASGCSPQ
jgi:hypothetical protein